MYGIVLITIFIFYASGCITTEKISENDKVIFSTAADFNKITLSDSEPFRLVDQFSNAHAISNYKNKNSIFITYVNSDCLDKNKDLITTHIPQKTNSVSLLITDGINESYENYKNLTTPVLFDDFQFVTKAYNLHSVGSFVEIRTTDNQIISRGQIQFANKNEINCKQKISQTEKINFSTDVADIFSKQCMYCHMGHKNLDYFTDMSAIQNWSKMSLKTMQVYRMPPGGADTKLKYPLATYLKRADLLPLYKWLENAAPFNSEDEKKLQLIRSRLEKEILTNKFLKNRTPDFIFKMQNTHVIPATGSLYYTSSLLGGPFKEDTYLEAASYQHNLAVLHHSNIYVISDLSEYKRVKGRDPNDMSDYLDSHGRKTKIAGYLNGKSVPVNMIDESAIFSISRTAGIVRYKYNNAVFIPKGSYLILENHYTPNGNKETNQSTVSFYKHKGAEPPIIVNRLMIQPRGFEILPNQSNVELVSIIPVNKNIKLIAYVPHMHHRGKDTKLFLKKASGERELLVSVPYYTLKLERSFYFEDPIQIPKGSELELVVRYDNSILNTSNPDPSKKIKFGASTYENEMHSMRIYYSEDKNSP